MTSIQGWLLAALAAMGIAAVVVTLRPDDGSHSQPSAFVRPHPPAKPAATKGSTKPRRKGRAKPTSEAGAKPATTKAGAKAYARAVNLRASDVPYFKVMPSDGNRDRARTRQLDREFDECIGVDPKVSGPIVHMHSPSYGTKSAGGVLSVQSAVEVLPSASLAARRGRIYLSERAKACFDQLMGPALEEAVSGQASIDNVSISRLPPPMPAADESFGLRISASLTAGGDATKLSAYHPEAEPVTDPVTVPIYVDVLGFVVGSAEVDLTTTGAPKPASRNLELNILRLLYRRAEANRP